MCGVWCVIVWCVRVCSPHLSRCPASSSLPVSPPVVYSVSYCDSSSSGLRRRLFPRLAEGLRTPAASSEGLELTPPPRDGWSDGRLDRSEYLKHVPKTKYIRHLSVRVMTNQDDDTRGILNLGSLDRQSNTLPLS